MLLAENRPYRIVDWYEVQNTIMLILRGYEDPREFKSLLIHRSVNPAFRRLNLLNKQLNGEGAAMKLKYFGLSHHSVTPIIRISGNGFSSYLR
jgi:hypothetical protein